MTSPTLSFDGNGDYVDCGDKAAFEPNQITTSVWVKPQEQSAPFPRIYGKANDAAITEGYRIQGNNGDWIWIWVSGGNNVGKIRTSSKVNQWNHYTWTHDGSVGKLYENGELVGSDTTGLDTSSPRTFYIGTQDTNSNFYTGELDDLRIFNTALSQQEVKDVMDGHIIGSETALWSMNEGSGNTITDATTNNNSGQITGATWSTRSKGNTYSWGTPEDWDNSQSEDDVDHEPDGGVGIGSDSIQIGQAYDQLTNSPEEAYYKVNSPNVSGLQDVSPANNDGTLHGATKVEEPNRKFTASLDFDGQNDYVECPSAIWGNTTFVAFESWVYPRSGGEGVHAIMNKPSLWSLRWDNLNNNGFDITTVGTDSPLGPNGLSTNQWYHVNCYWNAGNNEVGLSVNGSSWDTFSTNDGMTGRGNPVYFGNYSDSSDNWFDGKLTEIRCVNGQKIPIDESLYLKNGSLLTAKKS